MKALRHIAALTLLGMLPGVALASATRPLQLELRAPLPAAPAAVAPAAGEVRPMDFARGNAQRSARVAPLFQRNGARLPATRTETETRVRNLRRQALENVLDPGYASLDEERAEGRLQLKFNKRSNAFRDLGKSYREMCDRVSQKIWDDPNGKRIRFDVAGKPGVGIEIPVGHHR